MFAEPFSFFLGINILGFRPLVIFLDLVEPYSLLLLTIGHALSLSLGKNTMINDLKNILTGDVLGSRVQGLFRRGLSSLLPLSSFSKLLSLYNSYYTFITRFGR